MFSIQNVLHPTDFSDGAAAAFEHALHLARQHEAALHLLHVVPTFGEDPLRHALASAAEDDAFLQALWAGAGAQMQRLVEAHAHRHVDLRRVLLRGAVAAPVILGYAEAHRIDVIVMGTHGRRGVKHLLLGSVAEEVAHHAPCHVMTVRRQKGPAGEPRPIQRILAPIDFSEHATDALRTAKALAAGYGAQLHLLHVVQPLPFSISLTSATTIHDLVPDVFEKMRACLTTLFDEVPGPEVPVEIHVVEGQPARSIVEAAGDFLADLIVMAPRGLTGVERFFLGSVAERVMRTAACPVFLAKTPVPAASDGAAEAAKARA